MVPPVAAAILAIGVAMITTGCGGGGGSNAAPALGAASFTTIEDTDLSGQLSGTDADGDAITFAKATDPAQGTLASLSGSGAFVYKPNANYAGADSFTVRLTDARGASVTSTVSVSITAVNDAPTAVNDVTRVDGAALASIDLKANDADAEGDAVAIAITEPSSIGTATVNADGTVSLSSLPAGFKGITRFKYSAADSSGASNTASAAIFVGTDPFRVVFAGDENGNGQPELFMTDFVATFRISSATEGNLRLRGFAAAENGKTVAYTRQDSSTNALDLSFIRTDQGNAETRMALPSGYSLVQGADQYGVSRDGQWVAFLATAGSKVAPFVFNVGDPAAIRLVEASGSAVHASLLKFSYDSSYLYFLGSNSNASEKTLYRVLLSGNGVGTPLSVGGSSGNDVKEYQIAQNQSRVAIRATRSGVDGVYAIDPTAPVAETLLSSGLGVLETVQSTTLTRAPGLGTPVDGNRVAFTTQQVFNIRSYVDNVGGSGGSSPVESFAAVGLSPGGDVLLYSRSGSSGQNQIWKHTLADGSTAAIGDGVDAVFDSDQATVILTQTSGSNTILTTAYAESFGTTTQIGASAQVARFYDLSGASRAVALIGEGAASGTVDNVHLALINARAPATPLFLGAFNSPLDFGSSLTSVVTY